MKDFFTARQKSLEKNIECKLKQDSTSSVKKTNWVKSSLKEPFYNNSTSIINNFMELDRFCHSDLGIICWGREERNMLFYSFTRH